MDELGVKLAELADKLGVAVEELWPLMVQKVVVDWWVGAAVVLIFWIVLLVYCRFVYRSYKNKESWVYDEYGDVDFPGFISPIVGILWGIFCIGGLIVHISSISNLFFPEIAALQNITSLLK